MDLDTANNLSSMTNDILIEMLSKEIIKYIGIYEARTVTVTCKRLGSLWEYIFEIYKVPQTYLMARDQATNEVTMLKRKASYKSYNTIIQREATLFDKTLLILSKPDNSDHALFIKYICKTYLYLTMPDNIVNIKLQCEVNLITISWTNMIIKFASCKDTITTIRRIIYDNANYDKINK